MKSLEARVAELEMRLQMQQRELARAATRPANPLNVKTGWWVAKLDEVLNAGGTAVASIWVWNNGAWEDSGNNVTVQDYFLGAGESLDAGTKIEVAWHRNVWIWRRPGGTVDTGIPFLNDSGFSVPPGGIMLANDEDLLVGEMHQICRRPSTLFDRFWLVNGATTVPHGTRSLGYWRWESDSLGDVAIDTAVPPGPGEEWGPKPGSFLLHYEYPGFTVSDNEVRTVGGQAVVHAVQRQINKVFGRLYTDLEARGECELEILHFRNGSWRLSPFDPITVQDFALLAGETREKGTKAEASWWCSHWIVAPYCEREEDDGVEPAESQSVGESEESMALTGPNDFDFLPEF